MRYAYVIAATILAACTVPPSEQKPIPVSPAIDMAVPQEDHSRDLAAPQEDHPKLKQRIQKVVPMPTQSGHPCAGIKTDDPKSDVKAQLECLEEHG